MNHKDSKPNFIQCKSDFLFQGENAWNFVIKKNIV